MQGNQDIVGADQGLGLEFWRKMTQFEFSFNEIRNSVFDGFVRFSLFDQGQVPRFRLCIVRPNFQAIERVSHKTASGKNKHNQFAIQLILVNIFGTNEMFALGDFHVNWLSHNFWGFPREWSRMREAPNCVRVSVRVLCVSGTVHAGVQKASCYIFMSG